MTLPSNNRVRLLALIPARGGSKGIPRKNLRLLCGKPLVAYSIEAARQTPGIERVVVSTDDAEIADVSRRYGAEVVWRPAEISGDSASSEAALLHALDELRDAEGYEPDLVVFLQATSPLRRVDDVRKAIDTLASEGADSLFSACPVEGFVWRAGKTDLVPLNYDPAHRPRRQELQEEVLEENGSIYVFKPWVLRTYGSRLGGRIAVYRMSRLHSFQVDEPADLELVERLLALRRPAAPQVDLACIRLLVLDFDGVLTDNRVLVNEEGLEAVLCDRADSLGIARLRAAGLEVAVISTEANSVVRARCAKLGIQCTDGCHDKLQALQRMAAARSLQPRNIAYLGNDVNDADCMRWVGVPIAVADAAPAVWPLAKLVTSRPGGRGAVREVSEWLLAARGQAPEHSTREVR